MCLVPEKGELRQRAFQLKVETDENLNAAKLLQICVIAPAMAPPISLTYYPLLPLHVHLSVYLTY